MNAANFYLIEIQQSKLILISTLLSSSGLKFQFTVYLLTSHLVARALSIMLLVTGINKWVPPMPGYSSLNAKELFSDEYMEYTKFFSSACLHSWMLMHHRLLGEVKGVEKLRLSSGDLYDDTIDDVRVHSSALLRTPVLRYFYDSAPFCTCRSVRDSAQHTFVKIAANFHHQIFYSSARLS